MKVLITGSEGQVGKKLARCCKQNNIPNIALSRKQLDITSKSQIHKIVDNYKPSVIINTAAFTNVDSAEDNPDKAFEVNAIGPKNLAYICNSKSIFLIHISTDYVFDGLKQTPYKEDDAVNPINVYGSSKLKGEEYIQALMKDYIILRTSWVFSETGKNFVKTMIDLSNKLEVLRVVGDQIGSPTSAESIAIASIGICKAYQSPNFLSGIYHFSGKDFVSWYDFAKEIIFFANQQGLISRTPLIEKISSSEYPMKAKKPTYSFLSSEKIERNLDISPNQWRKDLEKVIHNLA